MMLALTTSNLLAVALTPADCAALARDMTDTGLNVVGQSVCSTLVRDVLEMEPDAVVLRSVEPTPQLFESLAGWLPRSPCPLVVFVDRSDPEQTERAIELGVNAWVVGSYAPQRLPSILRMADARWRRDTAIREELEQARRRLDERKWVERAKGVLMAAREIGEEEAYQLLRNAAMQRQARMGDVSRTVIDASHWAEAVNRAGQLRMLSQRLVRVYAQRIARVSIRRAVELQEESMQRTCENIARLQLLVPPALHNPGLSAVVDAWRSLQSVIDGRPTAAAAVQADGCAEVLLGAAELLTRKLEVSGGRRALRVVNLAGRQRMLAQRVAKEVMLAIATERAPSSEPLAVAVNEFETALADLEHAPLSSEPIRAYLAAARDEWVRMLRGMKALEHDADRMACAFASDALVQIFDRLTEHYQRSLEALMG